MDAKQTATYVITIEFTMDRLTPDFRVRLQEPEFDWSELAGDVSPQEQLDFELRIKNYFATMRDVSERTIW